MIKETSHLPKVVFIGASYVGKTTISQKVANNLHLQKLSIDTVLNQHNFYPGEEDEMLDWIEDSFDMLNPQIIDVGGNTLTHLNEKQLERFKQIIGEDAIIYHLKPFKSNILSYLYLSSRVDRDSKIYSTIKSEINQFTYKRLVKSHIKQDTYSKVFDELKTNPTIYTLKNNLKSVSFPFSNLMSNKKYASILQNIADSITGDLTPIFSTPQPEA